MTTKTDLPSNRAAFTRIAIQMIPYSIGLLIAWYGGHALLSRLGWPMTPREDVWVAFVFGVMWMARLTSLLLGQVQSYLKVALKEMEARP